MSFISVILNISNKDPFMKNEHKPVGIKEVVIAFAGTLKLRRFPFNLIKRWSHYPRQ